MSATRHAVRAGAYYDSLVLLQLQRALAALPGVLEAGVVMATPANREILAERGLLPAGVAAHADDLLIVVRAAQAAAAEAALERVDELLRARREARAGGMRPRSLAAALRELPGARWVLVSVPGRHAAALVREALDAGRHVFLYSDNVALAEEVELKRRAAAAGLLLLGPDCGTARLAGIGLGFANRVREGPVGLVGASGTGLQAVMSRLHALGTGVSQVIGTGGRDLHEKVGGGTTLQALDLLRRDPATAVIGVIAKPPAPAVAARVLAAARDAGKPVVVYFLGQPPAGRRLGPVRFAASLAEAAEELAGLAGGSAPAPLPAIPATAGCARGLFSGGTLAYEALIALEPLLGGVRSNAPLRPEQRLVDARRSSGHTVLDLGADEFTAGRPHPMLDHELLLSRLRQEAADPEAAVLLLDVVLGHGAHPDPAADLAPTIAEILAAAAGRALEVIVILIGTEDDPQGLAAQAERLRAAGALVVTRVEEAAERIWRRLAPAPPASPEVDLAALAPPLAAVNVGLESFHDSLIEQGAAVLQVDWRPPAGGDEKLAGILARMRSR
jgi:FdrA protein